MGNNLVQNVKIQWKFVNRVNSFQHLPADGTLDLVITQKIREAGRAKGVSTSHQDPRNSGTDIVFESAKVTIVKTTSAVVGLEPGN